MQFLCYIVLILPIKTGSKPEHQWYYFMSSRTSTSSNKLFCMITNSFYEYDNSQKLQHEGDIYFMATEYDYIIVSNCWAWTKNVCQPQICKYKFFHRDEIKFSRVYQQNSIVYLKLIVYIYFKFLLHYLFDFVFIRKKKHEILPSNFLSILIHLLGCNCIFMAFSCFGANHKI